MASLAPVPASGSAVCPNCSAPLLADQRYCLSCGQPASPVRLAFLDVLQGDGREAPTTVSYAGGYPDPGAGPAWLRRYAPLFGVAAVLLLAMLIGLLIGHWVSEGKKAPATAVYKIEGLGGLAAGTGAAATGSGSAATTGSGTSSTSGTSASSSTEEKQEEAEAKAEEKAEAGKQAEAPKPKSVSKTTLTNLTKSTGKKHQEEINKLGTAPIAVP